jgi:hypothetical protein
MLRSLRAEWTPWHFIVVNWTTSARRYHWIHEYSKMLKHAPAAIIVCADWTVINIGCRLLGPELLRRDTDILICRPVQGLGASGWYVSQKERVEGWDLWLTSRNTLFRFPDWLRLPAHYKKAPLPAMTDQGFIATLVIMKREALNWICSHI